MNNVAARLDQLEADVHWLIPQLRSVLAELEAEDRGDEEAV
jgi:hypothetical protein